MLVGTVEARGLDCTALECCARLTAIVELDDILSLCSLLAYSLQRSSKTVCYVIVYEEVCWRTEENEEVYDLSL